MLEGKFPTNEPQPQTKPLLSIEKQIEHLKFKGVMFDLCSEAEATEYLSDRTYYFKLAAYRTLFQRRIGGARDGQYIGLDFGHLKALSSLDRDLRYALLPLTLDVEHAARTKLIRTVTERPDEDGYSISADYIASLNHSERRRREGEVNMLQRDVFCGDLVRKYGKPSEMPIWVLMELFSFGSFIDLYLFCAKRWSDKEMSHEHYMLRQAKSIRNACAHSSDILNKITEIDVTVAADETVQRALAEAGASHRVRTSKMRNPRIKQIATLMYLHTHFIDKGTGRKRAISDLANLRSRMTETASLMPSNDAVCSSLSFLITLIDNWFQ